MKIAFLLFSMTGAGEERIASLLLRQFSPKNDIMLVLFNGPIDYELPEDIEVHYLRKEYRSFVLRMISLPILLYKYYRLCVNNNIQVSLSFDNVPNYINCLLRFFGWSGKVWIREVTFPSRRFDKGIRNWVHRFLIRKCYPLADTIYINAFRIKDNLSSVFNIDRRKIKLFNNPIDVNFIAQQASKSINKPDTFTCIHVGAFRPQKNHALLIDAFNQIKHLNFHVWLLGKGVLEESIKTLIDDYGLASRISFLGFQENPYQYMEAADLMVLSSDYEGLPNVLLESLVCKLPIVSTNCSSGPLEVLTGNPEATQESKDNSSFKVVKHGILCPVGNAQLLSEAIAHCIQGSSDILTEFKSGMENTLKPYLCQTVMTSFQNDLEYVL